MTGMTRQGAANNRHTSGDHANSHATGAIDRHTGPADIDSRLSAGRQKQLERTIEGEIIPRLMLVHKQVKTDVEPRDSATEELSAEVVIEFTRLILTHDIDVAYAYFDALHAGGRSLESLFLELLGPTARYLGELWKQDACDFMDVTLGLSRLQQLMRRYSPSFENETSSDGPDRRGLLAPAPGEQHTFGVFMVEEFFRRAGWDIWTAPAQTQDELVGMVDSEWYALVGLSVSRDDLLDELMLGIRAIRKASRNQGISVMVGGRVFIERPELVAEVGADATAVNGREAVEQAESLVERLSQSP